MLAAPQFPAPLAPELIRIAPDLVLPGLDEVERDRVFAVLSNAPFVHAVLTGANHEMMRELRWRGYPTDERGTAFHRFWRDDADEIGDLHTITTGALGDAVVGRRAAAWSSSSAATCSPASRGRSSTRWPPRPAGAGTDARLLEGRAARVPRHGSRPTSPTSASRSAPPRPRGSPGRYLAFQEPATSPSFGLDVPGTPADVARERPNDLAWSNVADDRRLRRRRARRRAGAEFNDNGATWGGNAADQAAATYQQPVRAAIHFRELLGGA